MFEGNKKNRRKCKDGDTYVCKTWGYVMEKCDGKWVRQHVLIMERKLGRKLRKGEVVHHRDEDRTNNNDLNLQLMTDPEHRAYHAAKRRHSLETRRKMSESAKRVGQDPDERARRSERAKQQHFDCNFGRH